VEIATKSGLSVQTSMMVKQNFGLDTSNARAMLEGSNNAYAIPGIRKRTNETMYYTRVLHFHFTLRWSQYDSMCAVCSIKEHRGKEEDRESEVQSINRSGVPISGLFSPILQTPVVSPN